MNNKKLHFVIKTNYFIEKTKVQLLSFIAEIISKFQVNEFAVFFVMSITLNLRFLTSFFISIDDEMHAYRSPFEVWLPLGRWTGALINRLVFPQPVIPYTPYLFFCFCLTLSYIFLVWAHKISKNFQKYLAFPVFIVFPVWRFITHFDSILPAVSFGTVLVAISGFLFSYTRKMWSRKTYSLAIILSCVQIFLVGTAIGAYQSFLLMYLAISFGIMLLGLLQDNDSLWIIFRSGIQAVIVSAFGLLFYYVIAELARRAMHINSSSYLGSFFNAEVFFSEPFRALRELFLSEMWVYYSGAIDKFGSEFRVNGLIIILSFLFIINRVWNKTFSTKLMGIFLWFMMLVSPFLLSLISIVLPTRSLFPLAYVVWFMVILLLSEKRKPLFFANVVFIIVLIIRILNINGLYAARSFVVQQYDRNLAAGLYNRLGLVDPEFDREQPAFIDVYGTINFSSIYPNPWSAAFGVSFFDWDRGNLRRMVNYMHLMGYSNLEALPDEQRLQFISYYESMPTWPASGSVKKVDDVYLIKLGDSPHTLHSTLPLYQWGDSITTNSSQAIFAGWHSPEAEGLWVWSGGEFADVTLKISAEQLSQHQGVILEIDAATYHTQTVEIQVNGTAVGTFEGQVSNIYQFPVPAAVLSAGVKQQDDLFILIRFVTPDSLSPATVNPGNGDQRILGVGLHGLKLYPVSK